jgi:3-hydroxybutyrate dehydrogenase
MRGRSAVVTGSTSGIGLAIATGLAGSGCNVTFNSFTDTEADHALAAHIGSIHHVRTAYVSADMASPDDCRSLIAAANDVMGPISILVNNAGIQHVAPVEDFPPSLWDAILAINLSAAFHTIRATIPQMRSAGWGRIINIASTHGLTASPFKSAYVSAKHGLVGLTKTVALETAEDGITCNAICPGYVLTPLVNDQITSQMAAHDLPREAVVRNVMLERQPIKRFIPPESVSAMALFLCSDGANEVTGSALSLDGGWTAL